MYTGLNTSPIICRKFQKYSTRYLSYVYGIKHVTNHMSKISKIFDTSLAICIRLEQMKHQGEESQRNWITQYPLITGYIWKKRWSRWCSLTAAQLVAVSPSAKPAVAAALELLGKGERREIWDNYSISGTVSELMKRRISILLLCPKFMRRPSLYPVARR